MASQELYLATDVPDMIRGDPDLLTDFWASPTKTRSRDYLLLGSQSKRIFGN